MSRVKYAIVRCMSNYNQDFYNCIGDIVDNYSDRDDVDIVYIEVLSKYDKDIYKYSYIDEEFKDLSIEDIIYVTFARSQNLYNNP